MLDKLNFKRDKIVDIQAALQASDMNADKQIDFDEWRQDLKKFVVISDLFEFLAWVCFHVLCALAFF